MRRWTSGCRAASRSSRAARAGSGWASPRARRGGRPRRGRGARRGCRARGGRVDRRRRPRVRLERPGRRAGPDRRRRVGARADRRLHRQHGRAAAAPDPLDFTREQWEAAHRTLVLSPMAFLERLLPGMRERGWGRVVAISSMAVREPIDALQLSNAHRPGLIAAFKVLARQAAGDGVTLNSVLPGRIATERIFGTAPGGREAAEAAARETCRRAARHRRGARRGRRLPLLGPRELHHGHDAAGRRRRHRQRVACPAYGPLAQLAEQGTSTTERQEER